MTKNINQSCKEIWTLSELKNGRVKDTSFELLAWGRNLLPETNHDYSLSSIVLTDEISDENLHKFIDYGADKVYLIVDERLRDFTVDPYAEVLTTLIKEFEPDVLIAAATSTGRTIMPYISALVHGGLTADCTKLELDVETGLLLQTRPAIGGNILATIKTPFHRPQMATVRPRSVKIPNRDLSRNGEIIKIDIDLSAVPHRTILEKFIPFESAGPTIESADIVVAGGKGLKNKNNFGLIEELADTLGGALGASRPPVDQGWKPYPIQVGLSGKTISPRLYIACAISGSVQHLAGIQTAENIIAINNDPHAQIFQVADYGVVANIFDFLPLLIEKLNKKLNS
jgi:electron transfer flavoprotein alpha subunit